METFWKVLTFASVAWYAAVTVYVAVRGAADIRTMLGDLAKRNLER